MSKDWYNAIALRNNGYKADVTFKRLGESGEIVFEERLKEILPKCERVLDIGCGHGEFTLKMAKFANQIVGADNAEELLKIASDLLEKSAQKNATFTYMWTHGELPFKKESFDLIYSRRGPMSILNHPELLIPGGKIMGVHSFDLQMDRLRKLVKENGWEDLKIETYEDTILEFESDKEFEIFLSANHMRPDYSLKENQEAFQTILKEHKIMDKVRWPEKRILWSAMKPRSRR